MLHALKLPWNYSPARISDFELATREPNLIVLLHYSKVSRVSINKMVDDDIEVDDLHGTDPPPSAALALSWPSSQSVPPEWVEPSAVHQGKHNFLNRHIDQMSAYEPLAVSDPG